MVLDLELIMGNGLSIGANGCTVKVGDDWIDLGSARTGWLRRFHRADWGLGVETGSLEALELGTWHSAYSWALETANVRWVTEPTALRRSESKLRQWRAATALGIPYPRTVVTTSDDAVVSTFPEDEVIVKPLGTGQFIENGVTKIVYAEAMMPTDSRLSALKSAPFIVQELLRPTRHLRVVTVGDRSWVAALEVDPTTPADWRRTSRNHSAFKEVQGVDPIVTSGAIEIASELSLGYSSQDWIQTIDGDAFLLDVNPAGQWLFLPQAIGAAVAEAIVDLLVKPA